MNRFGRGIESEVGCMDNSVRMTLMVFYRSVLRSDQHTFDLPEAADVMGFF